MKRCTKCNRELPYEAFNKNKTRKDGLATMCRECWKSYYKTYYALGKEKERLLALRKREVARIKGLILEKKSVPCVDCGNSYPSYVMDFDHRDPSKKDFGVSGSYLRHGYNKVLTEIEKCDVVCANCHRIRTHSGIESDGMAR